MNATQIREALSFIDSIIGNAPALVAGSLVITQEKLNKQLEKVAAKSELQEKRAELKKTVEESRNAMKELQAQMKAQREADKVARLKMRDEKKALLAAKKEVAAKKKEEREAALIAKAKKLQESKKAVKK